MAQKFDIIDLLLKQGIITGEQLLKAKDETKRTGLSLERAMQKLGLIDEEDIARLKADVLGVPYINLEDYLIDTGLTKVIPEALARKYKVIPLFKIGNNLNVGMVEPQDIVALDHIRRVAKVDLVEPIIVSEKGLQKAIDSFYGVSGSVEEIVKSISKTKAVEKAAGGGGEVAEEAPVIRIVNTTLLKITNRGIYP
jgi:type IV pilus assembly protein PilB